MQIRFQQSLSLATQEILGPICADEVHVYFSPLVPESEDVAVFQKLLSDDELARAQRFHFDRNRNEYILARGALRSLVGRYLDLPPRDVRFAYEEHGKPILVADRPTLPVCFNVSHTAGLVAIAFTLDRRVGVDVEAIRTNLEVAALAERFFSVAERSTLRGYSATELYEGFFRCWTRKEAYIKARGEGLSHPLAQFDVSIDREIEQSLIATRPDVVEASRWLVKPFAVPAGFAAAVAIELTRSDAV